MNKIEMESTQYHFKKVMQEHVKRDFAGMLYEKGFVQCKKNKFVREKGQLLQIITFRIEKDRMKVYAKFIPVFLSVDEYLDFGIELTGWNGCKLLGGIYFTTVYEEEKIKQEIQYRNYCDKHIASLQKIYSAIAEGILPEMDSVNSFEELMHKLEQPDACIFGYGFLESSRKGWLYQYMLGVYQCIYENFQEGATLIEQQKQYGGAIEKGMNQLSLTSREDFMHSYQVLCEERKRG